jgi:hypothetical protein
MGWTNIGLDLLSERALFLCRSAHLYGVGGLAVGERLHDDALRDRLLEL